MYEIQKASLLKRMSAFLLDFVLMTIAVTGIAFLLMVVTGYDNHASVVSEKRDFYEKEYGVDFDISIEDYEKLSEDEKNIYLEADEAFSTDKEVAFAYNMMFNLVLIITSLSLLISYLTVEFVLPLIFKNGQTLGKKIFGIGIVFENSVRITNFALFSRTVLGKYTVETMIPVILIVTMIFGGGGLVALIVIGMLLILELFVFFKGKRYTLLHDVLCHTVCVDMSTQMIFENVDELNAYKAKVHAEAVQNADY